MAQLKKIEAFSIMESAIAISVIATCLGIGALVFSNVISASINYGDIYLENSMDSVLISTKENQSFINQSIPTSNGLITKEVEALNKNGLYKITVLGISKANKKIKKIILINE